MSSFTSSEENFLGKDFQRKQRKRNTTKSKRKSRTLRLRNFAKVSQKSLRNISITVDL
jgi:hypothetical protein